MELRVWCRHTTFTGSALHAYMADTIAFAINIKMKITHIDLLLQFGVCVIVSPSLSRSV